LLKKKKTIVFYESVHRIEKALNSLAEVAPLKDICMCRELTKIYETIYRGKAEEILNNIRQDEFKGEFVIVIK